ncbi:hypothetical protein [Virgibacillus ihumii]|uniref:hypothetical protein n=1 Tax=Virgibacillus ihumii TaxID=2686091 RepID=UPI00157DB090|nr:hypothetical protein [Virgibacillus ihumii]
MYKNLLNALEQLQEKIKTMAPSDVLHSLHSFKEMAGYSIEQQEIIEKTVKEGLNYAKFVNNQGVLVEENVTYLHQNKDETMRALNQKQLNQMETDNHRKKVLFFLFKKMWIKPALFFDLLSLIRYQLNLRSNKGSEADKQRKLKKRLDTGALSHEQVEADKDLLKSILNPKN